MRAEAWQAIPGVSVWVMTMVRRGYTFQFAHHHSAQRGRPSPPRRGDESAGKRSH